MGHISMMRYLLLLVLWVGSVSPSLAITGHSMGIYDTYVHAKAGCDAEAIPLGRVCVYGGSDPVCPGSTERSYYRDAGSYNEYSFCVRSTCPEGESFNESGKCEPAPEPEECSEDQTWNSQQNACVPDTPEPELGSKQPKKGIPSGTCDSGGGNCVLDDWLKNGESTTTNCGGWSCKASVANSSEPANCYTYPPDTTLYCDYEPIYQGDGPYVPPQNPIPTPPPETPPSSATPCPTGYVSNGSGGCVRSTSDNLGNPSDFGEPGQQSGPPGTACPIGYTMDAQGVCRSGEGQSGCPTGYTLQNGVCVGDSPTGSEYGKGACGADGQPACKIDLGGGEGIAGWGDAVMGLPSFEFDLEDMPLIDLGAPAAQCPADVQLPKGIVWSWATVCAFAEWMRPIFLGLSWLLAGFIVLSGVPRD
jgi:hypothetical protein